MSKKDDALKLALAAERVLKAWDDPQGMPALCEEMNCLREALAEQPAQQGVDWEKLYRLEVKRKEALAAKYERDTGKKLTRIVPMAEQPTKQEPYGWKVYGVNSLFAGEFAEADAKAEAKRIGGTCIAFPLYTSPQPSKPLTQDMVESCPYHGETLRGAFFDGWIKSEAAHGIKEKNNG